MELIKDLVEGGSGKVCGSLVLKELKSENQTGKELGNKRGGGLWFFFFFFEHPVTSFW